MAGTRSVGVGVRFDRLVVTGYAVVKQGVRGRTVVLCRCDCGKTVERRAHLLRENKTNSCGCRPNGKWAGVGDLSRTFFYRLRRNAEIRGVSVEVTMEQLWEVLVQQGHRCRLSGLPITLSRYTADTSTASVDRIDSTKGYTTSNIQWVHKDVNKMKMDLPESRFKELCKLIADRHPAQSRESG